MGAKLCCISLSTSDFDECPKAGAVDGHEQKHLPGPPPSRSSMFSCIVMPKEDEEKRDDHSQYWLPPETKAMKMTKLTTLEEWILSSPGMKPADHLNGGGSGELHVFKQSAKMNKVRPSSSSRVHAELITSSPGHHAGISKERIDEEKNHDLENDRGGEGSSETGESRRRKQPGKRVKFRWPEADVIMFHSPPEGAYEEIDHKQSLPRV